MPRAGTLAPSSAARPHASTPGVLSTARAPRTRGDHLALRARCRPRVGATPRYLGSRAFFGPTADLLLTRAPSTVAIYAGGVRPEALRAAAPEPEAAPEALPRAADAPEATLH